MKKQEIEKIKNLCEQFKIHDYEINEDGTVDVFQDVRIRNKGLDEMPINFGLVSGLFDCADNALTSLKGSPKVVIGSFDCGNNQLENLSGTPKYIGGCFDCSNNNINDLSHRPKFIGSIFNLRNNQIIAGKSLEELKELSVDFELMGNPIFDIWKYFRNRNYLEVFLEMDIIRHKDEDGNDFINFQEGHEFAIILDRLNMALAMCDQEEIQDLESDHYIIV